MAAELLAAFVWFSLVTGPMSLRKTSGTASPPTSSRNTSTDSRQPTEKLAPTAAEWYALSHRIYVWLFRLAGRRAVQTVSLLPRWHNGIAARVARLARVLVALTLTTWLAVPTPSFADCGPGSSPDCTCIIIDPQLHEVGTMVPAFAPLEASSGTLIVNNVFPVYSVPSPVETLFPFPTQPPVNVASPSGVTIMAIYPPQIIPIFTTLGPLTYPPEISPTINVYPVSNGTLSFVQPAPGDLTLTMVGTTPPARSSTRPSITPATSPCPSPRRRPCWPRMRSQRYHSLPATPRA